jgi:phospholipid/cholesterol/gamma-HCH transport system substrate-binding protein
MQSKQKTKIARQVGGFSLFIIVCFVGSVVVFQDLWHKKINLFVQFPSLEGAGLNTQVRVHGVFVGQISELELNKKGVLVTLKLNSDTCIPIDSTASFQPKGLLGDMFLQIEPGDSLQCSHTGQIIVYKPQGAGLNAVLEKVNAIAGDVANITSVYSKTLSNPVQAQALADTIQHINHMAITVDHMITTQQGNVNKTMHGLVGLVKNLNEILTENRANIKQSVLLSRQTLQDVHSLVGNVTQSLASENNLAGNLLHNATLATAVNDTVYQVRNLVTPLNKLNVELEASSEYRFGVDTNTNNPFLNEFNLRLHTSPSRYYQVGLGTQPFLLGEQKIVQTTTMGSTVQIINTPQDVSALALNLQIAQQIATLAKSPLFIRGGLINGSVGLGLDYTIGDTVNLTAEISQFGTSGLNRYLNTNYGPFSLKLQTGIPIYGYINLYAGVDGLFLLPKPFPFAGLSLQFTDNDVKSFIGSASLAR